MKRSIHIYSQYYFPVANACSNRVEKYVMALKNDYDITVVTWMPNYPTWVKSDEYKWKLFKKEYWNYWEKIVRTYEFATRNEGAFLRILNYISFMLSSFIYGFFSKKPDKIIVTSPPLFTAISVLLLNKIRNIPYILEIRDLWPDSVVALGFMKAGSLSYKVFSWFEIRLYENAEKVIWVTRGICESIEQKWYCGKVFLQYNVTEKINWDELESPYVKLNDVIKWKKIVLFAWNMNEAYDFSKTSKYIKKNIELFFVFIWDGSAKKDFQNALKWVDNVLFLDRMKKDNVDKYLYYCDSVLVPLKNEDFYKGTFPVKGIEGIVNGKEIIFFWPNDGEFNKFLKDLKSWKDDSKKLKLEYFRDNVGWLVK